MTTAKEVAHYIISEIKKRMSGEYIEEFDVTPLKLQKLLYYVQGYSLALTGKPAFSDKIEAWQYGPVVDSVYQEYKKYSRSIIPYEDNKSAEVVDEALCGIVSLVLSDKLRYSAETLARATHSEAPWVDSYEGVYTNAEIPEVVIKEYFICEFERREEDYADEDKAWDSIAEPVSKSELEAALAEI